MTANATARAYAQDIEHFDNWCEQRGLESTPASPERVALYLRDLAEDGYAYSTIVRRRSGIAAHYRQRGMPDPCRWPLVADTLRELKGRAAPPQRRATLDLDGLSMIVAGLSPSRTKDIRDKALLLVGFWGCYRRSDLANLTVGDVGAEAVGRAGALPDTDLCPVAATSRWLTQTGLTHGPLWRLVNRHGTVSGDGLSGAGINEVVAGLAESAGMDGISSYSMRYGVIRAGLDADLSHRTLKDWMGVRTSRTIDRCAD